MQERNHPQYDTIARLEQERAAAVAEAAATREVLRGMWVQFADVNRKGILYSGGLSALEDCKATLDDPSPAVERLEQRLAPMPCGHPGACAVTHSGGSASAYCAWCEEVDTFVDGRERLYDFAMKSNDAVQQEMAGLRDKLGRAEAMAALVPRIVTALGCAAYWLDDDDTIGAVDRSALAVNLRALAARIEDARRERGQENGDGD